MKRYKIAAILIIIHGIIEIAGFFSVLPVWLGVEQGGWIPFDPPPTAVVIVGVIWGVIRIIGGIGLLKNLKWGLALSVITCTIAIAKMLEQYFGNKKATE